MAMAIFRVGAFENPFSRSSCIVDRRRVPRCRCHGAFVGGLRLQTFRTRVFVKQPRVHTALHEHAEIPVRVVGRRQPQQARFTVSLALNIGIQFSSVGDPDKALREMGH